MATSAPASAETAVPHGAIRVVVADDSAAIRTLARYALAPHRGFAVAEAADSEQALRAVRTFHPDCLVLDLQMPDVRGFEALDRVHDAYPDLPVVVLSGDSDSDVAAEAVRRGAASYLVKDGPLKGLADLVRRVADGRAEPEAPPDDSGVAAVPAAEDRPAQSPLGPETGSDAEVRRLEAELKRLEYVVSHDLSEPVRIMRGFAGLLESRYGETLDVTAQTFVRQIGEASARVQGMLDDLLAYSRAGRRTPRSTTADATSVARSAVASLRDLTEERGASVTVEPLPSVVGDPEMLAAALRELLENALTFSEEAPPTVRIEGRVDGADAVLTVTDNGIGVPADDRERVFDLFVRLHPRGAYPGTGTGLALCRRLMRLQGGSVRLGGATGGGTVATLVLPATPTAGKATSPAADGGTRERKGSARHVDEETHVEGEESDGPR